MEPEPYLRAAAYLLDQVERFPDLELVDLGGGFGIPHRKLSGEQRLDLRDLNKKLTRLIRAFTDRHGRDLLFKSEPGRYVVAECGVLLGTVHAVKETGQTIYAGTDLGFNALARPILYDSWHDIRIYRDGRYLDDSETKPVTVVGNVCESGDIIAADRPLPDLEANDVVVVLDTGAYGYAMSSNYNNRLRPAEVLIRLDGEPVLIRRRETYEDLLRYF